MNLKNYQEKADYILKKEEEMSFKEFAEGLLNYSFQKGLEKELNKPMSNVHLLVEKYAKPTLVNRIIWKILS